MALVMPRVHKINKNLAATTKLYMPEG